MNDSKFHGIINYTEAKETIFIKSLGLPINILTSVKMTHHKYPTIQFKLVGSNLRSSCLDHIYVRVVDLVHNISHVKPCFGDHELIMFNINVVRPPPRIMISRNWKKYSQVSLNGALSLV